MNETRSFRHSPESVTAARRFVTGVLRDTPAAVRDVVALMVSELAANCIRHTDGGFELTIRHTPEEIRVEATDCGGGQPRMRRAAPTDPSGRGLQIVDMFSDAWGCEDGPGQRKTVWFMLALRAPSALEASPA